MTDNTSASVLQDNSASVDRISVKIPPFWPNDTEIWFLQVENQFTLANITSDATKFNYIVANLDTAYILEVREIIVSPPATERYVKLKLELIKRLSASQQQNIKRLLEHAELGDRRPSQFFRHLQSLAGTTVPDNIVRSLWLGRLPSSTQAILAIQAKASLDAVAELADTISEAIAPRAQISGASNALESTIDKLTAELADTKIQLASLSQAQAQTITYRRNRSNSRRRPYPRDSSYSREHNSDILCWYHYRFGDQAQKCSPPCKHQGNIAGSR
ncbi:uncharacterized protein LOC126880776 [Diabrotica virgifera virgifera]|uniref:DUF7041 domain-containing protein n=1 Tax=Diabrotica virgifera virgifera TaxID=50390 RepID=A0ABM5JS70_DIAVI|nr:uncharacterized protein LOC126880776 [Diabrotica virgifera virgifera]